MAKGYRAVDRGQSFLMPPDMREWLPASDPVWWFIDVVGQLDTSELHAMRRVGGPGRAGFDPDMMLTLLLWAWAQGERSSRRIERACHRDVAFRVICAGDGPDHTTVARFRKAAGPALPDLFAQVLVLCRRVGLVRLGVIALDGTKIAGDASLEANLSMDGLVAAARREAEKAAAEHADADAVDDGLFGVGGRGDDVPDDPGTPSGRAVRIRAAMDRITADEAARVVQADTRARDARAVKELKEQRGEVVLAGRPSGPATVAQVALAERRLADAIRVEQGKRDVYDARVAAGERPRGSVFGPVEGSRDVKKAVAVLDRLLARQGTEVKGKPRRRSRSGKDPVGNVTDPESGLQPLRGGGWLQGYNCQAVTSSDGVIIGVGVSANPVDTPTYRSMVAAAVAVARKLVGVGPVGFDEGQVGIGLVLADAGYLSVDNVTCDGPDRLIAVGKRRDLERAARDAAAAVGGAVVVDPVADGGGPIAAMAARLQTEDGITAYRQRSHIAETPFGDTKHNNGFRRMTGRGLVRAEADWTFNAISHNLGKLLKATLVGKLRGAAVVMP